MAPGPPVADDFDAALNLEEIHLDEGWEDGLREGETLGVVEGRQTGFAKGFEIGQEMGFYAGCHAVWVRCVETDPECFSERALRGIHAFGKTITTFPIHDPLNPTILDVLNAVRGKFKTVVALLGMHKEYNARDTSGGAGMSF